MTASATPLRGRRHWLVLSVLALALVVPVAVATPINAQTGQCTVVETAGAAELTFDTGNDRSINVRRDGGWLATLQAGSTSYTDDNAPGGATYIVRTRPGGVVTDITCTTDGGTPPPEPPTPEPPTPGEGECTVVETAGEAQLTFDTGNTSGINLRRDGGWLASLPASATDYTDDNAPGGATYVVRTRLGGTVTDITCTTDGGTPPPEPEPPTVDPGECTVVETAGQAQLTFDTGDAASINLRRNGGWLASLSGGSTSYTDTNAPGAATYVVRSRPGGVVTDITCTIDDGTPPPEPQGERVIHISMDGLRSDYVTDEITPHLMEMIEDGASTLNARTDPADTRTLPNHVSQFTGRFVFGEGGHMTTFNEDPGNTIDDLVGFEIPSVFDIVSENGGATIFYAGKEKFDYVNRTYEDALDVYVRTSPDAAVQPFLSDIVEAQDELTYAFFHIRTPDDRGHVFGWGTPGYEQAVVDADIIVGQLLDGLAATGLLDSTTIIVTSDHGGADLALFHNTPLNEQTYTVPFIVTGPDVLAGSDLYELNNGGGAFTDPGETQVGQGGIQPIRGHDAANLGLDLLGLPALASTSNQLRSRPSRLLAQGRASLTSS